MTKQKEKFINGCIKNGMTEIKAEDLFKLIEPFAAYGFNKAHAASYAIIAYQTAYMKANFPVEFMTAVMTAEADDPDKISAAVNECTKMGIVVLPPDINDSQTGFSIENAQQKLKAQIGKKYMRQGIRFGLSAIKNVGRAAIEAIISERESKGDFKTLDDFVKRVNLRVVNRKTMESLIKAGAMDRFGRRNGMLKVLDEIKASGSSLSKSIAAGQGSLFDEAELEAGAPASSRSINAVLESTEEAPREEILSWERELLGFYLSEHPLTKVSAKLSKVVSVKIGEIDILNRDNQQLRLGGIIASIRKTFTKVRKEEMCFLKLQDTTGTIDVLVFPRVYENSKDTILPDKIVVVSGKLESSDETPIVIAEKISLLQNEPEEENDVSSEEFEIIIPKNADRILLSQIYELLKTNPGDLTTFLVLPGGESKSRRIPVPFGTQKTSTLEASLTNLGCQIVN